MRHLVNRRLFSQLYHLYRAFFILFAFILVVPLAIDWAPHQNLPSAPVGYQVHGGYYHMANAENKIALTFDDGPHPYYTPQILQSFRNIKSKPPFLSLAKIQSFILKFCNRFKNPAMKSEITHLRTAISKPKRPKRLFRKLKNAEKPFFKFAEKTRFYFDRPVA